MVGSGRVSVDLFTGRCAAWRPRQLLQFDAGGQLTGSAWKAGAITTGTSIASTLRLSSPAGSGRRVFSWMSSGNGPSQAVPGGHGDVGALGTCVSQIKACNHPAPSFCFRACRLRFEGRRYQLRAAAVPQQPGFVATAMGVSSSVVREASSLGVDRIYGLGDHAHHPALWLHAGVDLRPSRDHELGTDLHPLWHDLGGCAAETDSAAQARGLSASISTRCRRTAASSIIPR